MSDDLIERLRDFTEEDAYAMPWTFGAVVREAAAELARLRAEVERLTAALSDERAHADALAEALTTFINGGNRQLALISRKVKVTDPMTLTVTKGQLLAAIEARATHRARRQG